MKPIKLKLSPIESEQDNSGGAWPLKLDHVEDWAWREHVLTPEEADAVIEFAKRRKLSKARTGDTTQSDKVRNSEVCFFYPNGDLDWLFAKLTHYIVEMNDLYFGFDLTGLEQGIQFTKYEAPGQHYTWHMDRSFHRPTRKLSVVVQLSDPNDYSGGDLQLQLGGKHVTGRKERCSMIAFPSYVLHRVRPVTKGTRFSLVCWVSGPPFK